MKVVIKGGRGSCGKIANFFLNNILTIMKDGLDIEVSDQVPNFYKKVGEGPDFMPTAEVFVDLSRETIKHALKGSNPIEINPDEMRKNEFLAVKKMAELKPNFKINFHSFISLSQ